MKKKREKKKENTQTSLWYQKRNRRTVGKMRQKQDVIFKMFLLHLFLQNK